MKVKCEITLELDSGEFQLKLHNITAPGEPMDFAEVRKVLRKAVAAWETDQERGSGD